MSLRKHIYAFTFPNAAARLAYVPRPTDVNRVAKQMDNGSFWTLRSHSPVKWDRLYDALPMAQPFELLYQSQKLSIPEEPGTVIADLIIDLAQWGLVADQSNVQPDYVITKPGPGGTRIPTFGEPLAPEYIDSEPPGFPQTPADPPPLGVFITCVPLIDDPKGASAVLPLPVPDVENVSVGVNGIEVGEYGPDNRCRYIRMYAARTDRVYTPEEWAYIQTYKLHFNVTGPNNVLKEWVLDVPAAQRQLLLDETFDLREYGLSSSNEFMQLLVEFRRGGQIIRGFPTDALGGVAYPAYAGEQFDPPTYPIRVQANGIVETPDNDYEWQHNNTASAQDFVRYGPPQFFNARDLDSDVWLADSGAWAYCTSESRSLVRLKVWRTASDGATEYVPARDDDPIAIPGGAKDGCTVHVKLLRAGANQQRMYPFSPREDGPDEWKLKADIAAAMAAIPVSLSVLPADTYTTATRPLPDASWHRKQISVKDDGADEELHYCRQKADSSYEWIVAAN